MPAADSLSLRALRFEHPVDELWRRHRDGPPGWPPQAPVRCCVHRAGRFEVSVPRLDDGEAALLEALGPGRALGELPGAEGEDAAARLFRMIERGWGTSTETSNPGATSKSAATASRF